MSRETETTRLALGSTTRGQRVLRTLPDSGHDALIRGRLEEVGESVEEFLARPAGWKRDKLIRPEGHG